MQNTVYAVYIMASDSGTLYTGFTHDLIKRVWEHKNGVVRGFTAKYSCHKLVYYEFGDDKDGVLAREKQIKGWNRKKKEDLIRSMNPSWKDLYQNLLG
jgi:putative endonuclease